MLCAHYYSKSFACFHELRSHATGHIEERGEGPQREAASNGVFVQMRKSFLITFMCINKWEKVVAVAWIKGEHKHLQFKYTDAEGFVPASLLGWERVTSKCLKGVNDTRASNWDFLFCFLIFLSTLFSSMLVFHFYDQKSTFKNMFLKPTFHTLCI